MLHIGNFKRADDGHISGKIETLMLNIEVEIFAATVGWNERATHIVMTKDMVIIGTGRSERTNESEPEYIALTIDDPTFPAAFFVELKRCSPGEYDLFWTR